ncbi:MAG: WecB/TagA/CpsF family glycosyltransferase [Clostridia bacterium]
MREYFEKIYKNTEKEFHSIVKNSIKQNKKMFIVTANPETLMIAEENKKFKECLLDNETIIVPDGIGVVKGARILGYDVSETITGVELAKEIFDICNNEKKSIYLFGAKKEVINKLKNVINDEYSNIKILGAVDGYVLDKQKVFENIIEQKPDVVLVALGIPNQELLIYENINNFEHGIFIGVGGSFDVLSGAKKRAPKVFRKFHLEWLYRIMTEPKRLKRFFRSNVKYLMVIKKEKKEKK